VIRRKSRIQEMASYREAYPIMKVFPLWMKVLGREEVVMKGVD
jgi:hypothetical protein